MATGNGGSTAGHLSISPQVTNPLKRRFKAQPICLEAMETLTAGCTWIFVSAKLHTAGGLSSAHGLLIMNLGQRRPKKKWFPHLS